ncbi:MAG: hypothetical protein PHR51_00010 [Patescibacteria group bacterium]|nr:hypothetical protein [Patescibacteria group bacterium]
MIDYWFGGITAFGGMSVGIELSEEALSHAVHLAFLCECSGGKPRTFTHYEVIPGCGLCLYDWVDDKADHKPSALPNPYTADQAVTFIRQWLENITAKDDEEFRQFAGPEPDTDGSTSHTAFILGTSPKDVLRDDQNIRLNGQLILVVRPAWMVYGK